VIGVVETDRHYLAGPRDRCEQTHICQSGIRPVLCDRSFRFGLQMRPSFDEFDSVVGERRKAPGELDHAFALDRPQFDAASVFIPDDLHRKSL